MAFHQIFSVCRVFELDDSCNVLPERRAKNGDHLITQNEGGDNNNTESTPHPRDYMSCFIKKKPIRIQYLSITIPSTA